jgi:hypothetical protein
MADVVGTFDEVKDHDSSNIHKVLRMAVFVAPWETAPVIASLVDSSNEVVIPDAYESVGILDKENALTATPSITASEVSGYGYAQTLRRDIVSRNTTINLTMLESRRQSFELYYGIDLSAVQATSSTGGKDELVFDEPDRPDTQYYRVLCLGADGDGANTLYIADFYPRCTVSDVAALAASETEPRRYGVTLGVDTDTTIGTGHRQFFAGPGLTDAKVAALGFTRAA